MLSLTYILVGAVHRLCTSNFYTNEHELRNWITASLRRSVCLSFQHRREREGEAMAVAISPHDAKQRSGSGSESESEFG